MPKLPILFLWFCLWASVGFSQSDENPRPNQERVALRKIKVFPNPATHTINVLGLENSARADIALWDVYGNVVLRHRWEIKRNALNIPIGHLPPGIYSVTIQSPEQEVRVKFYKQ